jgi:hypothetical protein
MLLGPLLALSIAASMAGSRPAHAQGIMNSGCIGSWNTLNCVTRWAPSGSPFIRLVPPFPDGGGRKRALAREQRWVYRCRPVIRQDRYGVARYHYALPGCEFGVGEY